MQSNRRDHIRRVLASLSTCVKISRFGPEKLVPKFRVRKTALVVFTWPPLSLGVAEKASVVPGPASVNVVALIHSGAPFAGMVEITVADTVRSVTQELPLDLRQRTFLHPLLVGGQERGWRKNARFSTGIVLGFGGNSVFTFGVPVSATSVQIRSGICEIG